MANHRSKISGKQMGTLAFLFAAAFLTPSQSRAQAQPEQTKFTVPYAKAALASLAAIQNDDSVSQDKNQDKNGEGDQASATLRTIDATDIEASTDQEVSITRTLRQIYRLKVQDNDLVRAYQKLIEIESADDGSDQVAVKRKKDEAVAELSDSQATIRQRENACFTQLQKSLRQRLPQELPACSGWLGRAKMSGEVPVESAISDEANPQRQ
jgi:ABC-type transporter MlaC component